MSANYLVRLYSRDGVLLSVFDDWRSLNYNNVVNGLGDHTFSLNANDSRAALFTKDTIFQVMRRPPDGSDWYEDYAGLTRTPQKDLTETGLDIYTTYGRGLNDMIRRRIVGYQDGTAQSHKEGLPADDILTAFVNENLGPLALVSNGRVADGVWDVLSVNTSPGFGPVYDAAPQAWHNLLDVMEKVAHGAGVDFKIYMDPSNPGQFFFSTYWPQLGVNRTQSQVLVPPIVFSTLHGNMFAPTYVKSATDEVTRVIVIGEGTDEAREVAVVENTSSILTDPWNICEDSHDERAGRNDQELEDAGIEKLNLLEAHDSLTFTVIQTDQSLYGVHYRLGDICTARFGDVQLDKKLVRVGITVNGEDGEIVSIEFGDVAQPQTTSEVIYTIVRELRSRIQKLETEPFVPTAYGIPRYQLAGLPAPGKAGRLALIIETGRLAVDNGTSWRYVHNDSAV